MGFKFPKGEDVRSKKKHDIGNNWKTHLGYNVNEKNIFIAHRLRHFAGHCIIYSLLWTRWYIFSDLHIAVRMCEMFYFISILTFSLKFQDFFFLPVSLTADGKGLSSLYFKGSRVLNKGGKLSAIYWYSEIIFQTPFLLFLKIRPNTFSNLGV